MRIARVVVANESNSVRTNQTEKKLPVRTVTHVPYGSTGGRYPYGNTGGT